MRIRDKINKKKLSHYMFNDEEIVCMNKKYFNDNYISKDKIRNKIKELEDIYQREEEENGYNDETYMYYIPQIKLLKQMLGEL